VKSSSFHKLIRARLVGVAIANAAVAWVVLIIAPLGLFAVIVCTVGVFLSSLGAGWVGDRALLYLLEATDWQEVTLESDREVLENRDRRELEE